MTEETKERCPLSGIPCSECGYPQDYCAIDAFIKALEMIAEILDKG